MTFNPDQWGACEAAKIAPLIVPYVQGRCLDLGSGPGKVWPSLIGIDKADYDGRPITDMKQDATDLSLFGDNSFDAVFSSFLLHQIDKSKVPDVLKDWTRVLKTGGYMILYVPSADLLPTDHDDPSEKWRIRRFDIIDLLQGIAGWDLITDQERSSGTEYGLLTIVRKREDNTWNTDTLWQRNPNGKQRALVIRYGAIGDSIVAASILPLLQEQGYHVTFNCTPKIEEILRHDPHIDQWLIQETDFVPNETLGPYWTGLEERYDKIVNLCESVEGLLLTMPGRLNHMYSASARRRLYDHINYHEHTHNIADVPFVFDGAKFYPTADELKWAHAVRKRRDGPVIVWTVNGSSVHKVYGHTHVVIKWLLERTPANIVLYGDPGVGKELQDGIMDCLKEDGCDMTRVLGVAGVWSIRKSLTFAQVVDCVVGPETGPLNAVGMETVPKVIYLSHSAPDNLTKHWKNTTTLMPLVTRCPCYPCHRLHHTWEYCHKDERTGTALCAASIAPEKIFEAIAMAIGGRKL